MIDAGIHVCIAPGIVDRKIDVSGGVDYNNYTAIILVTDINSRGGSTALMKHLWLVM